MNEAAASTDVHTASRQEADDRLDDVLDEAESVLNEFADNVHAVARWVLEPYGSGWRFAHRITGATVGAFENRYDALAARDVFAAAKELATVLERVLATKRAAP